MLYVEPIFNQPHVLFLFISGFPFHTERNNKVIEQSIDADIPTRLYKEDTVSSGVTGPVLENV